MQKTHEEKIDDALETGTWFMWGLATGIWGALLTTVVFL